MTKLKERVMKAIELPTMSVCLNTQTMQAWKQENTRLRPLIEALVTSLEEAKGALNIIDHIGLPEPYDRYVRHAINATEARMKEVLGD